MDAASGAWYKSKLGVDRCHWNMKLSPTIPKEPIKFGGLLTIRKVILCLMLFMKFHL